jgi:hypothetical protein
MKTKAVNNNNNKPKKSRSKAISFPVKLHRMLKCAVNEGKQSIVSWNDDDKSFQVHNIERFVVEVLPQHFKQSKYKSFQRQLNFYNFQRVASGPNEGSYGHPSFLRGNEELCRTIKRDQALQKQPSKTTVDDFAPLDARRPKDCDCLNDRNDNANDLLSHISRTSFLRVSEGVCPPPSVLDGDDTLLHHGYNKFDFNTNDRLSFVGENFFFLRTVFDDM